MSLKREFFILFFAHDKNEKIHIETKIIYTAISRSTYQSPSSLEI